jgi:hypothetical protein
MEHPKHVEFHPKNKFEKLVHLVGFNIQICHDARSHERQKKKNYSVGTTTSCITIISRYVFRILTFMSSPVSSFHIKGT